MTEHSLSVTLKAGTGYDSPWVVVYGNDPSEVEMKLRGISGVIAATVEAANLLKAANNAGPLLPQGQEAQPPQQQAPQGAVQPAGWATSPPQAEPSWAAQPQQQAQPAPVQQQPQGGQSKFAGPPHPEGKTCEICPNVLEFKKTATGKGTWRCSEWRWNNGSPNGHSSLFA